MRFVLASASPTRLRVLREAGFDPEVIVSGVDEEVLGDARSTALALAERKAAAIDAPDAVVLACDSVVECDGRLLEKPGSDGEAVEWWHLLRGRIATVWTGHCVRAGGRTVSAVDSAHVHFGLPTDAQIGAYVASGEPTGAAGAFRLAGRAAAFIPRVDGDPGTVHGVSIAVVASLLRELDIEVTDLWV